MAFFRWYPEIGRSSVEDHTEFLWRRADRDVAIVLGIQVVGQRFWRRAAIAYTKLVKLGVNLMKLSPDTLRFVHRNSEKCY